MTEHRDDHLEALGEVELRRIRMDLVAPFRTSFGEETYREILLVRTGFRTSSGMIDGWGECVAMNEPLYSSEYVDGAHMVLDQHLVPRLFAGFTPMPLGFAPAHVGELLGPISGHRMAKGALEMAVLDAALRARHLSYGAFLASTRQRIPSGVSVGIFDTIDRLLAAVSAYVDEGYRRIKLKIEPGWDLEPVRLVRELIGDDLGLQVDANTAYGRADIEHLCRLDEFGLLLIEQPLAEDDLLGHAELARRSSTPVCLDESIVSVQTAADALDLGAAQIINIKPGRVGGYLEAQRIHDLCQRRDVAVWCGGMLETGIGRAANASLASLPGFTLPGDISASTRFYRRDIVRNPISLDDGEIVVPNGPGLGFELDTEYLDAITISTTIASA